MGKQINNDNENQNTAYTPDLLAGDTGEIPIIRYETADELYSQGKYEEAFKLYKQNAEYGDAEAQFMAGKLCFGGAKSFCNDTVQAKMWFEKAAAQGHKKAEEELKVIERVATFMPMVENYAKEKNAKEAQSDKAMRDTENRKKQSELARGLDLLANKDYVEGVECLWALAERGNVKAMIKLGEFLWSKEAIVDNELRKMFKGLAPVATQGRMWLDKAADLGDVEAQEILREHKVKGVAVEQRMKDKRREENERRAQEVMRKERELSERNAAKSTSVSSTNAVDEMNRRAHAEKERQSQARIASLNKNTYGK